MTINQYKCEGLNNLCEEIHDWAKRKKFEANWAVVPRLLMLVVSELGEAMEDYRRIDFEHFCSVKCLRSAKSTQHLNGFKQEIADTIIRICHMCAALGIDIEEEIRVKMLINEKRPIKHGKEM